MKIMVKMTGTLYTEMIRDLSRRHPFAAERVGFVFGKIGSGVSEDKIILLTRFHSIPDNHYLPDPTVGARIGPGAMTSAMQEVFRGRADREGIFHVHLHGHQGQTRMSGTDINEIPKLIPGFQSVGKNAAHGILILSIDHGTCWIWLPGSGTSVIATAIQVLGPPLRVFEQVPTRKALPAAAPAPVKKDRQNIFVRVWNRVTTMWR